MNMPAARSDHWCTPARFALFLAVLVFAAFPDVVLGQQTFFYRDYGIFGYPLAYFHRESFWSGELPLWNPLNNCGLPFLAQWNTMTLYPGALIYLLLPLPWALGVFCLAHLYAGGIGMFYLARHWTGNAFAGAVAGIAFAFNGFAWHALTWPNNTAAYAWMPWLILAVSRGSVEGGRSLIIAVFLGGMQMLAGAPEIIAFTWLIAGALMLAESFRFNRRGLTVYWRQVGRWGACIGGAVGLAAVQLWPFWELLNHSQRGLDFGDGEWAMPGTGWANLVMPLFHTYQSFHGVFVQPGQHWLCSYYPGIIVLSLALWGAVRVRDRRVTVLTTLTLISLIMALGESGPLFGWVRKLIPQIGLIRFPVKFVIPVIFALPLLAAYGVARFRSAPSMQSKSERWGFGAAAVLITITAFGLWWFEREFPLSPGSSRGSAPNEFWRLLALMGGGGGLIFLCSRIVKVPVWIPGCALLLLLWSDIRSHAPNLSPTVPLSVYEPGLVRALVDSAVTNEEFSRAMVAPESLATMRHRAVDDTAADYLGRRVALFGNCNLLDKIAKLNGSYALYVREAEEIISLLYPVFSGQPDELLDFLAVSRVAASENSMEWANRDGSMPLITAGQEPRFAQPGEIISAWQNNSFDPRKVVYLPVEAKATLRAKGQADVSLSIPRFRANEVSCVVESAKPAVVVIAQAHYPCWRASVDGVETKVWRANHAFQAVEVPTGRHQLRLSYNDRAFSGGAIVSALVLLSCGIGCVHASKGLKRAVKTATGGQ